MSSEDANFLRRLAFMSNRSSPQCDDSLAYHHNTTMESHHLIGCIVVNKCQDWDDSHGNPKTTLQEMLLPHEVVATFLETGETTRVAGANTVAHHRISFSGM